MEARRRAVDATRGLELLHHGLRDVPKQLAAIREMIAAPNAGHPERRHGYDLTAKVYGLLNRLRHVTYTRTQEAKEVAEELILEEGPSDEGRSLLRLSESLRIQLDAYRDSLDDILEQGRREETTRIERNQRVLGYALAALAGLSAVPLLVGQMSPSEITASLSTLPGFGFLGPLLATLQPWIVLLGVLGAIVLLGVLVALLIRANLRPKERGTDPATITGRAFPRLRRIVEDLMSAHPALREHLPVDAVAVRAADREACDVLYQVLDALDRADALAGKDVEEGVDAFLIRSELGARRPIPFPLPCAAGLIRYRLDPSGRWMSKGEFEETLALAGSRVAAGGIEGAAVATKGRNARDFAKLTGLL